MQRLLLVDDEPNVLNAIRRELAGIYEVETFTSPQEALRRAKEIDFALVVSDYRMPDMDGVTFLEHFGQMQPDAVRLILSGQADMDALIKAINVTHIYRFFSKPWNAADLKIHIQQALNYREAILENRRIAALYRQRFATPPREQERKSYRVLLVCPNENSSAALYHELTHHSAIDGLYGAIRYEMTHRAPYGGNDFQLAVDISALPPEALNRLTDGTYDLVIADFSMLETDGVEFFVKVRQAGADCACILVGESLDIPTLTKAINQVHIDNFLKHNWNGYELKSAVMRALRYRDLLRENLALADRLREQGSTSGNPQ